MDTSNVVIRFMLFLAIYMIIVDFMDPLPRVKNGNTPPPMERPSHVEIPPPPPPPPQPSLMIQSKSKEKEKENEPAVPKNLGVKLGVFSETAYHLVNPDVRKEDALQHFKNYGIQEFRRIAIQGIDGKHYSGYFDESNYWNINKLTEPTCTPIHRCTAFKHYLKVGSSAGHYLQINEAEELFGNFRAETI